MSLLVQLEVGVAEPAGGRRRSCPAHHDSQTCDELLEVDRLRDVVVGPDGDPPHPVLDARPAAEEHERRRVTGATQPTAHFEPVDVREVDLEQHCVDGRIGGRGECAATSPDCLHVEAVELQRRLEGGVAVVDEEHRRASHGDSTLARTLEPVRRRPSQGTLTWA